MTEFNAYQYNDLQVRSHDLYANTKYQIILSWLSGASKLKILNAGCGSGELSFLLAEAGHTVTGIDPSKEYVALGRKTALELKVTSCSFEVSSIEEFQPKDKFDCVVATDVLEHIKDDKRAAALLASFVEPNGIFIITVPAGQWLFGFHDESLGHFRRYSKKSLRRAVGDTAASISCRYFGFTLIPICLLYSRILRKPYPIAQSGNPQVSPFKSTVLKTILSLDKALPLPFGTSILMLAKVPR